MDGLRTTQEFILIDFEFKSKDGVEGNPIEVICMVSKNLTTGEYLRLWADDLYAMETHPFSNTRNQTLVAYYASAELNCFNALGWEWKGEILDLYTEFRNFSNGVTHPFGRSIIGALKYFGLPSIESAHKDEMRALAMRGGPFTDNEKKSLLEYCQSDVDSLEPLLAALFPSLEMPRALMRGKYNIPISIMETRGTPIDYELYQDLCNYWDKIKDQLIKQVDKDFGVYINSTFKEELFGAYLSKNNIRWERLPSGRLKLDEETFKAMSKIYPEIIPLRHLRDSLAKLRLNALQVGSDGRNRCLLSPFSSITGRNQPSTTKFIFGLSKWARGLIQPKPGMALAYIDWSQQEFGIAAALSGDQNMKDAYTSGDPYLAFAKQAHAVPQDATKQSHTSERDQYKQCVLATQYGMGADALAVRLKQPVIRARQLLTMHRKVYRKFWDWSDNTFNVTVQANKISTLCGWNLNVETDLNPRSLRNFPMQANAAELLRVACILMADRKIQLCAPIHDAVLIEAPEDKIEEKVKEAQACMEEASQFILSGFKLSSEAEIFRYPDRFLDDSAKKFWEQVMEILKQVKQ
jgi:hypothetical protein